jgi:hypothetical protein
MTLPINGEWAFDILVLGRASAGASAGYQIKGMIANVGGASTFLVGTPTVTILTENFATWNATVEADAANQALVIKVTGDPGGNNPVRWVASLRTVEVTY